MSQYPGQFIVVEGIDGSGLSTQAQYLSTFLQDKLSTRVLLTKEPSTGPIGAQIRQILTGRLQGIDERGQALLFAADRIDHIRQEIIPVLDDGAIVICDRYLWSTLAYQGLNLDRAWLSDINRWALQPDITIFIQVRPEIALQRIVAGRFQTELYERQDTLQEVYANFCEIARQTAEKGQNIVWIDGEQEMEQVRSAICSAVLPYMINS